MADQEDRSRLDLELDQLRTALERLQAAVRAAGNEIETAAHQQRLGSGSGPDAAESKGAAMRTLVGGVRGEIVKLRARIENAEQDAWNQRVRRADAAARVKNAEERLASIEQSPVWKAAKPLWKIFRARKAASQHAAGDLAFEID